MDDMWKIVDICDIKKGLLDSRFVHINRLNAPAPKAYIGSEHEFEKIKIIYD